MKHPDYKIRSIDVNDIDEKNLHDYLLSSIAPRPIALVSTVDENGVANVSPYSFFNIFSANPPILIFSPTRTVPENNPKHTLENVLNNKECVVNIVTEEIVRQVSLASTPYDQGVNEFDKAGFTEVTSEFVTPPRVLESKISFECKVRDIVSLGDNAGAGNLVICEVLKIHLHEEILDPNGRINTEKMKLVARMGEDWYCKAFGDSLFRIPRPECDKGAGFDNLPKEILDSEVLDGNDLAQLANVDEIPKGDYNTDIHEHARAKQHLHNGKLEEAWKALIR